jgi:tetratricopeptide (TPR) repeat protein
MPYRGEAHLGPACFRHAAAAAATSCGACLQPICEICVLYDGTRGVCPPCARRHRRLRDARTIFLRGLGAASLVGLLVAMAFIVTHGHTRHVGVEQARIEELSDQLAHDPCDRVRTMALSDALLRAGDFRGVLKRNQDFSSRCGPWSRLLWTSFSAHRYLSEHQQAVEVASELIERSPGDKDFRWWRGLAYEEMGELELAAADYREALRLEPRLDRVPFNLIDVLERLGRPCEGVPVLEAYLRYRPNDARSPILLGRMDHLRAQGCHAAGD